MAYRISKGIPVKVGLTPPEVSVAPPDLPQIVTEPDGWVCLEHEKTYKTEAGYLKHLATH